MPIEKEKPQEVNLNRRKFLKLSSLALAASTVALLGSSGVTTAKQEIVRKKIFLKRLPPSFDGYRIGFLTDTHIGISVPLEWLDSAVTQINKEQVDLLLLGGDYTWLPESGLNQYFPIVRNKAFARLSRRQQLDTAYRKIAQILARVKTKNKVFGVLGNHDNWYSPQMCRKLMQNEKTRILVNQHTQLRRGAEKIELIGFDDYWTGRPKKTSSIKPANKTLRIVLSHNPDLLSFLRYKTPFRFDLGLAGHTHGGQIKAPLLGALYYGVRDHRLAEGLFQDTEMACYNSRGIGVSAFPVRINCPAEITILTLKKATPQVA